MGIAAIRTGTRMGNMIVRQNLPVTLPRPMTGIRKRHSAADLSGLKAYAADYLRPPSSDPNTPRTILLPSSEPIVRAVLLIAVSNMLSG